MGDAGRERKRDVGVRLRIMSQAHNSETLGGEGKSKVWKEGGRGQRERESKVRKERGGEKRKG